jgi:hypothetical protein
MKLLSVLALLAIAGVACAQISVTPMPVTGDLNQATPRFGPVLAWDNFDPNGAYAYYYPVGAGIGAADDAHLPVRTLINGFGIGYYAPGVDYVGAEAKFYSVDANGAPQLEAWFGMGLPGGMNEIIIDLEGWAEFQLGGLGDGLCLLDITFDNSDAGMLICGTGRDPGDDLFWVENPFCSENFEGPYWFGGDPYASFAWQLYTVPEPAVVTSLAGLLLGICGIAVRRK